VNDLKPPVINILKNDSWAAPALGGFIFSLVVMMIVLLSNQFMEISELANPTVFIMMTIVLGIYAIATSLIRIRYINALFEKGIVVQAQILKFRAIKATLRLTLSYTYLSQPYEKKVDQVITIKTKKLMQHTTLDLVIDPENPHRVLIRDAYF